MSTEQKNSDEEDIRSFFIDIARGVDKTEMNAVWSEVDHVSSHLDPLLLLCFLMTI